MKMFNAVKRIIISSYSAIMLVILIILLFFSNQSYYQVKEYNNLLLLPIGLLLLFAVFCISRALSSLISICSLSGWKGKLIIAFAGMIICVLQYRIISSGCQKGRFYLTLLTPY